MAAQHPSPAADFLFRTLPEVQRAVASHLSVVDPEDEPYKSKYAALQLLEQARQQAVSLASTMRGEAQGIGGASEQGQWANELVDAVALLDYRRATVAADVDEATLAKALLESAEARLSQREQHHLRPLLDIYNLLALVATNAADYATSISFLVRANHCYKQFIQQPRSTAPSEHWLSPSSEFNGMEASLAVQAAAARELREVEALHTMTTFYLAQTYASLGRRREAAAFCALTLTRQLQQQQEELRAADWAQNCAQLSGYYLGVSDFSTALYCLLAASTVLRRQQQGLPLVPPAQGTGAVGAGRVLEGEEAEKLREVQAAVAAGVGRVHLRVLVSSVEADSAQQREGKVKAAAEKQQQQQQNGAISSADAGINGVNGSHSDVDMDVDGGKAGQLEEPGRVGEGGGGGGGGGSDIELPASWEAGLEGLLGDSRPDFSCLGVSREEVVCSAVQADAEGLQSMAGKQTEGSDAVRTYSHAVVHFNAAMTAFKAALEVLTPESFFSDHYDIVMDISTLHKNLAYFEPSAHRAALIHKRRAVRLLPLTDVINPAVYPGQVAQLRFELATTALNVMELEGEARRPAPQIIEAANEAVERFNHFLALFANSSPPESLYGLYLSASFNLGRVYYRLSSLVPPKDVADYLMKSSNSYKRFLDHSQSLGVQGGMQTEVALAQEMMELLPAKLAAQLQGLSIS